MTQVDLPHSQTEEDRIMRSQMEQMVGSYDSYMRKMTLGRERALRKIASSKWVAAPAR
jgi:hypothetical protein